MPHPTAHQGLTPFGGTAQKDGSPVLGFAEYQNTHLCYPHKALQHPYRHSRCTVPTVLPDELVVGQQDTLSICRHDWLESGPNPANVFLQHLHAPKTIWQNDWPQICYLAIKAGLNIQSSV